MKGKRERGKKFQTLLSEKRYKRTRRNFSSESLKS